MNNIELMHGNCLELLDKIKKNSIDLIVTSPPYNIKKKYHSYKDDKPREEYLKFIDDVLVKLKNVLKDEGSLFLNISGTSQLPWIPFDIANVAKKHFVLQNNIIWVKNITINDKSYGHFKPINSKRYLNQNWEFLFHFTKEGKVPIDRLSIGTPYADKSNIKRWNSVKGDKRCAGNVWYVPYTTINSKKEKGTHPAIFPAFLVKKCIKLHGYDKNTILLDPFSGTGTSLLACQELGINGIGMELDIFYIDYAKQELNLYD